MGWKCVWGFREIPIDKFQIVRFETSPDIGPLYKSGYSSVSSKFLKMLEHFRYHEQVRKRTLRLIGCIPPDSIEWRYADHKFSIGDLVRHIAITERYIFAESMQFRAPRYPGCGKEFADGYGKILEFFTALHQESIEIFSRLTPEDLKRKCLTPAGTEIALQKWMILMTEHEIHHRGQLYVYLGLLNVPVPPLYGVTSEEARERS